MSDISFSLPVLECEEQLINKYVEFLNSIYNTKIQYTKEKQSLMGDNFSFPNTSKNQLLIQSIIHILKTAKKTDITWIDNEYIFSINACILSLEKALEDAKGKDSFLPVNLGIYDQGLKGLHKIEEEIFMYSLILHLDTIRQYNYIQSNSAPNKLPYVVCEQKPYENLFLEYDNSDIKAFRKNKYNFGQIMDLQSHYNYWVHLDNLNKDKSITIHDIAMCIWSYSDKSFSIYEIEQVLYEENKKYCKKHNIEANPVIPNFNSYKEYFKQKIDNTISKPYNTWYLIQDKYTPAEQKEMDEEFDFSDFEEYVKNAEIEQPKKEPSTLGNVFKDLDDDFKFMFKQDNNNQSELVEYYDKETEQTLHITQSQKKLLEYEIQRPEEKPKKKGLFNFLER